MCERCRGEDTVTIDILLCASNDLWQPMLVLINSVIMNSKSVRFHVLEKDIASENKKIISDFVRRKDQEIIFYDMRTYQTHLDGVFADEYFYRLFAIHVLPKKINRCIYIDVDTVVDGDLRCLYEMDFDYNYIIASKANRTDQTYHKHMLGIGTESPYVYDGMMVMNLCEMRKCYSDVALEDFLKRVDTHHILPDMDFINCYFEGRIKTIDASYHSMQAEAKGWHMSRNKCDNPLVLHWPGMDKPWTKYRDVQYLYGMDIYCKYCNIEELKDFYTIVKTNQVLNENNSWIKLENEDRYDSNLVYITNERVLLDYAKEKIKYGNIFHEYIKDNGYKNIAFYGFNDVTRILVEEVKEDKDVNICCIIDRRNIKNTYKGIDIIQPVELKKKSEFVDVILVSVVNEFLNVKAYFEYLGIINKLCPISECIFWGRRQCFMLKNSFTKTD